MSSRCIPLIFRGKGRAPLTGYGHVESMDQPPREMKICIITTASQLYAVVVPPNIAKEQKKTKPETLTKLSNIVFECLSVWVSCYVGNSRSRSLSIPDYRTAHTASVKWTRDNWCCLLLLLWKMSNHARKTQASTSVSSSPHLKWAVCFSNKSVSVHFSSYEEPELCHLKGGCT